MDKWMDWREEKGREEKRRKWEGQRYTCVCECVYMYVSEKDAFLILSRVCGQDKSWLYGWMDGWNMDSQ